MTAAATLEAPPVLALAGVSIVLPCHNEAPNLVAAVRMASEVGRRWAFDHEVIVVDDGSEDLTLSLATSLAASDPAVRVVVHPVNRGYGAALRSGIAAARQPWVLLTDADLQFDLAQLSAFVPLSADHDVIVGYRVERQDPYRRIVAAAAWNRLVHALFQLPRARRRLRVQARAPRALYELELESEGATISTELLAGLLRRDARMAEVGVLHQPRTAGRQSGLNPRVVARALRELVALRRRLGRPEPAPASEPPGESRADVSAPVAFGDAWLPPSEPGTDARRAA